MFVWRLRRGFVRWLRLRLRFGEVFEGTGGGGTGQVHAEVSQLRAHAQMVRSAFVDCLRLAWRGGVQVLVFRCLTY